MFENDSKYKDLIERLVKSIGPEGDRLSDRILATAYALKKASSKQITAEINKNSETKVPNRITKKWLDIFGEMGVVKKFNDSYAIDPKSLYYRTFVLTEES